MGAEEFSGKTNEKEKPSQEKHPEEKENVEVSRDRRQDGSAAEGKKDAKLSGTYINEIVGLSMKLALKGELPSLNRYLERSDVHKKHKEGEIEALNEEIADLDEKVDRINPLIAEYNNEEEPNRKEELKKEILVVAREVVDVLYGDNPQKEIVKRNLG